ncbi:hypothetical protein L1987_36817 [Smallanthus sonchifolius]|uniref:Uncharacterized protein n=1 Tax=Smallanthus sonchifolius TaxID=185202 RepID=A0ACB9HFH2_9ASTR|nr:hypothetical protein L1987_36817 [Smallanthus sonchifolius]
MGKKRVTYGFNDEDKPPNHVPIDRHRHRHHNNPKPKKIKPEAKLLHTLNSHLKKLAKYRSKNLISLSSPPPSRANIIHENNKNHRGHFSSWLKNDHKDDRYDWFMDFDFDHGDGGDKGAVQYGQELFLKTASFLGSENNDDLFGGDFVFAPDLNASNNMVVVFEEYGLGYGSYIPDPVMNLDNGDEGMHIYDMLKLSSEEDMINEFLKLTSTFVLHGEKQSCFLDRGGAAHGCGGAPDRCGVLQHIRTEPVPRNGLVLHSTIRNMLCKAKGPRAMPV